MGDNIVLKISSIYRAVLLILHINQFQIENNSIHEVLKSKGYQISKKGINQIIYEKIVQSNSYIVILNIRSALSQVNTICCSILLARKKMDKKEPEDIRNLVSVIQEYTPAFSRVNAEWIIESNDRKMVEVDEVSYYLNIYALNWLEDKNQPNWTIYPIKRYELIIF